jgi:hypothetical protein
MVPVLSRVRLVLFLVAAALAALPATADSGLTLPEGVAVDEIEVADIVPFETVIVEPDVFGRIPGPAPPSAPRGVDPALDPITSIQADLWLPLGSRYSVAVDPNLLSLTGTPPVILLEAEAEAAVSLAPAWIRPQLRDTFRRMDAANQVLYGDLITATQDPWLDEVAFTVAHTSIDILQHTEFHPDLIVENVDALYTIADELPYADVVDYGTSADDDYWSTVRYMVGTPTGDIQEEYPREVYYWFVVHPKISDEMPTYIDPTTGDPADPPAGVFWRDYYYRTDDARPDLPPQVWPILRDALLQATTLWNRLPRTSGAANGAVGLLSEWSDCAFVYDLPAGERSIQPVRILYNRCGYCGEQQDALAAASRTALIPIYTVSTMTNDHTWCEFIEEGRGILWDISPGAGRCEPSAVIDPDPFYDGWPINAALAWRGDSHVWTVTEQYGGHITWVHTVEDASGNPVDGALVAVYAHRNDRNPDGTRPENISIAAWGLTNTAGQVSFTLGDAFKPDGSEETYPDYFYRVESVLGSSPTTPGQVYFGVRDPVAGETYQTQTTLGGEAPRMPVIPVAPPVDPAIHYVGVEWTSSMEVIYGRNAMTNATAHPQMQPGRLDLTMTDAANHLLLESGSPYEAIEVHRNLEPGEVVVPLYPGAEPWYLHVQNEENLVATEAVSLVVTIYENTGLVPPVHNLRVQRGAWGSVFLTWDPTVSINVQGYNVYASVSPSDIGAGRDKTALEPFRLGVLDPTTAQATHLHPTPPAGLVFYSVRSWSSDGRISE